MDSCRGMSVFVMMITTIGICIYDYQLTAEVYNMDTWMDGQMDGCLDRQIDGWIDGWMFRQINGWMDTFLQVECIDVISII